MAPSARSADLVRQQLDQLGAAYKIIEIDPEYADTAQFCERYGYSLEQSVNCILVASKSGPKRYAACLVQATRRLDVNRTVKRLMGARRVSFAQEAETTEVTGMTPGGVTPFGLPEEIPVYIDAPVMTLEEIVLGGGGRDTKILLSPSVFALLPSATVIEGLAS